MHTYCCPCGEFIKVPDKATEILYSSSVTCEPHLAHFSFCPTSLLIGCRCRNTEKPVKHTSSTFGWLIGEGLRLAAGYLPATSARPCCPRAQLWLLKQQEDGACVSTTCATVGGLMPRTVLAVLLLAAVEGLAAIPPVTHIRSKEVIHFQLALVCSLDYVLPEHQV